MPERTFRVAEDAGSPVRKDPIMETPPDRLTAADGKGSVHANPPTGRDVADSQAGRGDAIIRVVWLMPDTGVFPLWSGGGALTPAAARERLGLSEDLVADVRAWGRDEDSPQPPGGRDEWMARGAALQLRLQAELGPDWDVELVPE
jgi:hypothetical protein